jgi:lipoyl(octanoyl) transferase 2
MYTGRSVYDQSGRCHDRYRMTAAVRARLPILYHYLPTPVPYKPALELQERLHQLQLATRRRQSHSPLNEEGNKTHPDILLLLQHRPVYTGGRRQQQWTDELELEQKRLQHLGADWVPTARGGETTFHGPGQIVAYPLFDLGRMSVRRHVFLYFLLELLLTCIYLSSLTRPTRRNVTTIALDPVLH